MARPAKEGLEYFPLDVDIHEDDKLVVVIGKFGTLGFGIVIRLLMEIYKNGYFYPWTEREQYAFSNRVSVDINTVSNVINECIKWGFFDRKLLEEHSILTSHGIQKRYLIATVRRVYRELIPEYALVQIDVSDDKNDVSVDINAVNDSKMSAESTQSKVNKKKVNKSENKETYSSEFEDFWSKYPRKIGKTECFKKWQRVVKDGVSPELIIKCAENYSKQCIEHQTEERFIKHPKTFLNEDRYKDFEDYVPRGGSDHADSPRGHYSSQYNASNAKGSAGANNAFADSRGAAIDTESDLDQFVRR